MKWWASDSVIVDSAITLKTGELTHIEWERLFSRVTFFDSEEREIMVYHYHATKGVVTVPRGCWALIPDKEYEITDLRVKPKLPVLDCTVELDTHGQTRQQEAVDAMFREEQGIIHRQPGSGKTQILLSFIAGCGTSTLVVVPTIDIMAQWRDYAKKAIPDIEIGLIQGKVCDVKQLTLATPNTLRRYVGAGRKFWRQFGCIIADECHHVAAQSWEWIMNSCPAFYRFGATATVQRADEMQPLVRFLIGPVIHEQPFESQVPIVVKPIKSGFKFKYRGSYDWKPLLDAITKDKKRNRKIARLIDKEVNAGHSVLVLSRRMEHLVRIQEMLTTRRNRILVGSYPQDSYSRQRIKKPNRKDREQIIKDFRRGKVKCLLATQLADEALDVPVLSRVFLTFPGKANGRIIQQVGRAIRMHADKKDAVIFDIVDTGISILETQYRERKRAYRKMNIPTTKGGRLVEAAKRRLVAYR